MYLDAGSRPDGMTIDMFNCRSNKFAASSSQIFFLPFSLYYYHYNAALRKKTERKRDDCSADGSSLCLEPVLEDSNREI